ncbi:MAG TPA: PqiC family protein, partial [Nitrospira sp.]|nr:PqiC family protein [Nitrospira sp.]
GPIDFPDYLRRSQVVTRSAPNQIDLSTVERWGEPLDKNFQRVLSENLAQLLNTYRIEQYPWNRKTQVDYQVAINVQNFETTTDGRSQLNARWIIKDGSKGKDLYASETTANTPVGTGDTGASSALSNDLATLSREIASQVTELRQRRNGYVSGTEDPRSPSSAVAAVQP